jgi:quercetin dioxygenase-like cupin family protein
MSDEVYVEKGWGYEKWIVNKKEYCGKLLFFKESKKCSIHFHTLKDETFYVDSGKVEMHWMDMPEDALYNDGKNINYTYEELLDLFQKNEKIEILSTGQSFYVPVGRIHRVVALEDTKVFEFSTEHFDSDSYRLEKGD